MRADPCLRAPVGCHHRRTPRLTRHRPMCQPTNPVRGSNKAGVTSAAFRIVRSTSRTPISIRQTKTPTETIMNYAG